jgi:hypothetical protein
MSTSSYTHLINTFRVSAILLDPDHKAYKQCRISPTLLTKWAAPADTTWPALENKSHKSLHIQSIYATGTDVMIF